MSFQIAFSADFETDAKGKYERVIEEQLSGKSGFLCSVLSPQPGNIATPEALNQLDALHSFSLRVTKDSVRGVERLAVIARWGVGYDMIDVDAITEAGIALAITPAAVRRPVAEAIFAFVFALLKNMFEQDRVTRAGGWRPQLSRFGRLIPGHVLGSVGCGNIAREMFRLARPLGFVRLIACDPFVKPEAAAELGVELVDHETLFRESDFLTVNTFLNASTRHLVGARELGWMKPTAFLINTARGPIVDEAALVDALRSRRIAGAGLDVFEHEPPAQDNPLFQLDNVILAPHALAWTSESMHALGTEAFLNTFAVAAGDVPPGLVNRDVLQHKGFQQKLERLRQKQ